MTAKLMDPEGKVENVVVIDKGESQFVVRFTPHKAGVHTVSVIHKGQHISGSPFQFTVGPLNEGGAHKVRAGGPGLARGEVNAPGIYFVSLLPLQLLRSSCHAKTCEILHRGEEKEIKGVYRRAVVGGRGGREEKQLIINSGCRGRDKGGSKDAKVASLP